MSNHYRELEQQATKLLRENGFDNEGRDYKPDQTDPLIIWPENEAILQQEQSSAFTQQKTYFATDPQRELDGRKPYGLTKINALARDFYPCHSSIHGWFNALNQKILRQRKGKKPQYSPEQQRARANQRWETEKKYTTNAERQKAYRQRKRQEQKMKQTISPGQTFNTKYESGCKAITEPDENGQFTGLDSDGVECDFSVEMIA